MKNIIPKDHLADCCKLGCGEKTCAYLALDDGGWTCLKTTAMRNLVEQKLRNRNMTAKGDNCEGFANKNFANGYEKTWN